VLCSAVARADPLAGADAAFDEGDYSTALARYDAVLEQQPELTRALLRSATLLSWENRLDEALGRFELALSLEPGSREAALGRARVLSWQNRLDQALLAYEELLASHPDDAEILRGLALTLAWKGDYDAARRHYESLLGRDAGDVDALIGTARTYAWSGELERARQWYERALGIDPVNKDASIGLGYVEFWSGDLSAAAARAEELERRFPSDKEIREYVSRVRSARAPWVRTQADRLDDTDDNRLETSQVSGGLVLPGGQGLSFGVARYEMEDPTSSASIDSLYGSVSLTLAPGQDLTLRLGVDRREDTTGETSSDGLGGAFYTWGLDRRWQVRASASRDAIRYSPTITDNGILVDDLSASGSGAIGSRWRVDLAASAASLSDDNSRRSWISGFSYRLPVPRVVVETGYRFRWLDYDEDLDSGYFDPQDFASHLAQLRASGDFGARKHTYGVTLDWGVQSFTQSGVKVTDDTVVVLTGTLGLVLGKGFVTELFAATSDYAVQTATGFESDRYGLRLRWKGR
jgi:tetratricopeptide (TPR) repeat protein